MRDAVRGKSYQAFARPGGRGLPAAKRKRLTDSSCRDYEGNVDKFCRHFVDLKLRNYEPPVGTRPLEEFSTHSAAPPRPGR